MRNGVFYKMNCVDDQGVDNPLVEYVETNMNNWLSVINESLKT